MRVVIAPDSFKGSLSAPAAALAMARGVRAALGDETCCVHVPIADGGEGTVDALLAATGGERLTVTVSGPLGDPVQASFGILPFGEVAVVEVAAASGLPLVQDGRRDPRVTSTEGTGELIRHALDRGVRKLVVGLGGSATNDGGSGLLRALGARFLDGRGEELPPGGAALARLDRIDLAGLDPRLQRVELEVACDVDNPLTGARGASAVFGPQKGASPEVVAELDAALARFAAIAAETTGRDLAGRPGAGAAGGLGAGLLFFTGARLRPGVELVLETLGFDTLLAGASLVLTGEGRTDRQTVMGKAPVGVARAAKRHGLPVVCISGSLGDGADEVLAHGIDALASASPCPMSAEEAMARAGELLEAATARACRLVEVGMALRR